MRIKLTYRSKNRESIRLPLHYNAALQAFIYHTFSEATATFLHDMGFPYQNKRFKFFTFSQLLQKASIVWIDGNKYLEFHSSISFFFSSPKDDYVEELGRLAYGNREGAILNQQLILTGIEVVQEPVFTETMQVRMVSPITVYRTVFEADHKQTRYFSPKQPEFCELLQANIYKKYSIIREQRHNKPQGNPQSRQLSVSNEEDYRQLENAITISPVNVSRRNHFIVTRFKDTPIEAWYGEYEIKGKPDLIKVSYDTGLGSKNSAGFGMWEPVL